MIQDVFQRATTDDALFHTMLSVSHLIADSRSKRSLMPAFQHQTKALSRLQQSISETEITEAVAISVAIIAWINMIQSNRPATVQHIQGLFLIFQEIQSRCLNGTGPSPLLMQIWRFSVRIEVGTTLMYFPYTPLFPPVPHGQDDLHRQWVRTSTRSDKDAEWILASLALDNLLHRACHVAAQAYQLRRQSPNDPQIRSKILEWTDELLAEHAEWKTREIIIEADKIEREANITSNCSDRFLDYPPLRTYNTFYGNLLNTWRMAYIWIDLIADPDVWPEGRDKGSKRYKAAIDICRTYASLGKSDMFPIGKVTTVFLAGVGLGGRRRSPAEIQWLYRFILIDLHQFFPTNRRVAV
jgi:hypothetical protein